MSSVDPSLQPYLDQALAATPWWQQPIAEIREAVVEECRVLWGDQVDEVAEVRDALIDGTGEPIRVRIYGPAGSDELPGLVWLHGGGWVLGNIECYDALCRALAARTPCRVISVDYRLAPEHPFPAAPDDCWAALRWVADHAAELRIDPRRLSVAGDSAGGNLAAVTAIRARAEGLALASQLLVYPVTDADFDSESYRDYATGLNLSREEMQQYWSAYLDGASPLDPRAAPLQAAALDGVAPALVQVAELDVLRTEGERYGRRLAEAGVPVTVSIYEGMLHGFLAMPALTPKADRALEELIAFLRRAA